MKNLMTTALITGGLMLMNAPEAAAHERVRDTYQPPEYRHDYGGYERHRSANMPRWLRRNESFRRWYRHTSLRWDRRIAWHDIYNVYRWERRRSYYRYDDNYGRHRHDRRHNRRDHRH